MPDAAIEAKQFLVSCCEAMSHKLGPSVIATIDDVGHAHIQCAAKLADKGAQSSVDCQRTRLVNNTPVFTADNCDSQSAAMAVTRAEAEFVQITRSEEHTSELQS